MQTHIFTNTFYKLSQTKTKLENCFSIASNIRQYFTIWSVSLIFFEIQGYLKDVWEGKISRRKKSVANYSKYNQFYIEAESTTENFVSYFLFRIFYLEIRLVYKQVPVSKTRKGKVSFKKLSQTIISDFYFILKLNLNST